MSWWLILITILGPTIVIIIAIFAFQSYKKKPKAKNRVNPNDVLTFDSKYTENWFKVKLLNARKFSSNDLDTLKRAYVDKIPGVYIITNNDNQKQYVGQSYNLGLRVPQHFEDSLKGNWGVYDDFKNGCSFTIKVVEWNEASMPSLNQLEAGYIRLLKADSYYNYNRSVGRNKRNKETLAKKGKLEEY